MTNLQQVTQINDDAIVPYKEAINAHVLTIAAIKECMQEMKEDKMEKKEDLREAKEKIKMLESLLSANAKKHEDEITRKNTEHTQQLQQYKIQFDGKDRANAHLEQTSMQHILAKTRIPASKIQRTMQFIANTKEGSTCAVYDSKKRGYDHDKFIGFDINVQFQNKKQSLQTYVNKMQLGSDNEDDEEEEDLVATNI